MHRGPIFGFRTMEGEVLFKNIRHAVGGWFPKSPCREVVVLYKKPVASVPFFAIETRGSFLFRRLFPLAEDVDGHLNGTRFGAGPISRVSIVAYRTPVPALLASRKSWIMPRSVVSNRNQAGCVRPQCDSLEIEFSVRGVCQSGLLHRPPAGALPPGRLRTGRLISLPAASQLCSFPPTDPGRPSCSLQGGWVIGVGVGQWVAGRHACARSAPRGATCPGATSSSLTTCSTRTGRASLPSSFFLSSSPLLSPLILDV